MADRSFDLLVSDLPVAEVEGSTTNVGSGLTDDAGEPANQNLFHAEEAKHHLLWQFHGRPRIEAVVDAFGAQVQLAETVVWQLYTERGVDTAVGVQLDGLGALVGEPRVGRSDAAYRQAVRTKILVNRSNGKQDELYAIVTSALGGTPSMRIQEHQPATFLFYLDSSLGAMTGPELARLLRLAKPLSVAMSLIGGGTFILDHTSVSITDAGIIDHSSISITDPDALGGAF